MVNRPYLRAVEEAFGADIDYAMLVKLYKGGVQDERKYSPAECLGAHKEPTLRRRPVMKILALDLVNLVS
jgi:hypothetical protein